MCLDVVCYSLHVWAFAIKSLEHYRGRAIILFLFSDFRGQCCRSLSLLQKVCFATSSLVRNLDLLFRVLSALFGTVYVNAIYKGQQWFLRYIVHKFPYYVLFFFNMEKESYVTSLVSYLLAKYCYGTCNRIL